MARNSGKPEIERKWLVSEHTDFRRLQGVTDVLNLTQLYLLSCRPGIEQRVRMEKKRSTGAVRYFYTRKSGSGIARLEKEVVITCERYHKLLAHRDPTRQTIRKDRYLFVYRGQEFSLDFIWKPKPALRILERELEHEEQEVWLPPFLDFDDEVTNDPLYKNSAHAAGLCPGYNR